MLIRGSCFSSNELISHGCVSCQRGNDLLTSTDGSTAYRLYMMTSYDGIWPMPSVQAGVFQLDHVKLETSAKSLAFWDLKSNHQVCYSLHMYTCACRVQGYTGRIGPWDIPSSAFLSPTECFLALCTQWILYTVLWWESGLWRADACAAATQASPAVLYTLL